MQEIDSASRNEERLLTMTNRIDATSTTINHSNVNRFAQAIERIGLAIIGAQCGLFVAALVAKANIEAINSLGVLFAAVLYGSIGFYFGINVHSLPSGASSNVDSDTGSNQGTSPIALASAIGTFLAAVAALLSVYMIMFDEVPPVIWNVGIGFGWILGVLLQLAAGAASRLGQFTRATG
jgi:hypothetical protein